MDSHDTVLSCILGLVVGDALGVPFEFILRKQAATTELSHMTRGSLYHSSTPEPGATIRLWPSLPWIHSRAARVLNQRI